MSLPARYRSSHIVGIVSRRAIVFLVVVLKGLFYVYANEVEDILNSVRLAGNK